MDYLSILHSFLEHGDDYQVLFRHLEAGQSVHAYLITGEKGTGKRTLSRLMAAAMLCTSTGKKPCCTCRNCQLALANQHPDQIVIEQGKPLAPGIKKDRSTIPVEDIREMIRLCGVSSTENNMHVVLIFDADKMTPQAQNCLLKTLEEPPSGTCIILVTEHPEGLLPTVISRCRAIRMKAWDDEYILHVLNENGILKARAGEAVSAADGSIGKAVDLAGDDQYWQLRKEVLDAFFVNVSRSSIIRISNAWKDRKQEAEMILNILGQFLALLAEARFYTEKKIDLSGFPAHWQRFSAEAAKEKFVLLVDAVSLARKQVQFSVNFQAVLERLLFIFIGEANSWQQ